MRTDLLLWLVVVEACGLAALPLALRLFGRLPDRGYGLSKALGLLLVTYLLWLPGMLGFLEYRRVTVLLTLSLTAGLCWWRWGEAASAWLKANRRLIGLEEATFLGVGLLGLSVRAFNADIIGQEKFMDLAFFNGFLASGPLPAEDSWLAGYPMAYYPFGYLLLSVPAKLAGVPGAYGYNMALVLVFALTVLMSTGLVANLVALLRRGGGESGLDTITGYDWAFGLLGGFFVAICGNLVGPLELLAARGLGGPGFWATVGVKNLAPAAGTGSWLPADSGWWWHSSRVIPTIQPDGITEFPYFSFLLGDLHPHFTALPLLLLIVALTLALLLKGAPRTRPEVILVSGLALGVPLVANTWDAAAFWGLYGLAGLAVGWRAQAGNGRLDWRPFGLALCPIPLGLLLFSPYYVGYASQRLGLALAPDRTPVVSLLLIFGPFLLVAALLGLRLCLSYGGGLGRAERPGLIVAVLAAAMLAALGSVSAALGLLLLALVGLATARAGLAWRSGGGSGEAAALMVLGLTGLSLAVLVGVELIYINDSFGTRMNTVFKFYYNVWLLLGLAAAPALAVWLGRSPAGQPSRGTRFLGGGVLAGMLALGLVYPLAATWSKSNGFRGPGTLNGAAFLERSKPGDAAAIQWLARQQGRPTVVEAIGGDYQEFGRVSTFSGLPTLLGWVGHQLQWRGQLEEYGRRQRDVETLYMRSEAEDGLAFLRRYQVKYVFVGSLERDKYGRQVDERFSRWLSPVFRWGDAVVYAVPAGEEGS